MRLSFIGLSGVGKSHWSRKLEDECGFKAICCDDLLDAKLLPELRKSGYSSSGNLSKWLGQPYQEVYKEKQSSFLNYEAAVMKDVLWDDEVFRATSGCDSSGDVVIATSGSVIYAGQEVMRRLQMVSTVVYLETGESFWSDNYQQFLNSQSEVAIIWGDSFNKLPQEADMEAMERCYPKLCSWREERYRKYADITIPHEVIRSNGFSTKDLLQIVGAK